MHWGGWFEGSGCHSHQRVWRLGATTDSLVVVPCAPTASRRDPADDPPAMTMVILMGLPATALMDVVLSSVVMPSYSVNFVPGIAAKVSVVPGGWIALDV